MFYINYNNFRLLLWLNDGSENNRCVFTNYIYKFKQSIISNTTISHHISMNQAPDKKMNNLSGVTKLAERSLFPQTMAK